MSRARRVGMLSVTCAVLAVGACGSTPKSTSRGAKLDLASTSEVASPAAPSPGVAIAPLRPTRYVLDGALADLGTRAVVWRLRPHSVNASDVRHFAEVLGVGGSPTRTSTGWQVQGASTVLSFVTSDGDAAVSYLSGSPSAVGGSAGSTGPAVPPGAGTQVPMTLAPPIPSSVPPPVEVPDAADATSIARGLLERLGVLAGHDWSTAVVDSGGVAVSCAAGMPCPTVLPLVSQRTVTFALTLAGKRVQGVDWSVTVGDHRRIESVVGEWGTPVATSNYPLRATTAVFADLQHGTARYPGPQPMTALSGAAAMAAPTTAKLPPVTVHVTGVSLGLARWNAYRDGQTVADLVPTYRFHARVEGERPYDIEVLALDPGAVTFTSPAPKLLPGQPVTPPSIGGSQP